MLLTRVTATQTRTMTEPRKFARRRSVVAKTQAKAIPRFLSSSLVITSSVSQLLYSFGKSGSEAKKRKSIEEKQENRGKIFLR